VTAAGTIGFVGLVGRTVIAPDEIGAGLVTAIIGTPYFLGLLLRTARRA
jgi:ferric hydroxamate transport system permease protein